MITNKYLTIRLNDMDIHEYTHIPLCMGIVHNTGDVSIPEQERCDVWHQEITYTYTARTT